jgi:hypothetical protein
MKTCKSCGITKELDNFSKNKREPDGLQSRCKECCKQYREQNKEKNKNRDVTQITSLECTKCGLTKDVIYFSTKENGPRGFDYWCKECRKSYLSQYRDDNAEKTKEYDRKRIAERIQWLQELKSDTPCMDCGQIYEPYCMDYDHVPGRGQKIKSVTRMVLDNTPKDKILEEIKKCDLVCLLCHNKRTFDRFNETLGTTRKYKPHQLRNINMINTFKTQPCAMCGKQYESYNMQIDHIDPTTKLYDVCNLKNFKVSTLLAELAKCQVLCALCHRKKSITEQKEDKYSEPRDKPPKRVELFYDPITNTKECGLCHQIKNAEQFRKRKDTTSGLDTYCKECFNKYRRERRQYE